MARAIESAANGEGGVAPGGFESTRLDEILAQKIDGDTRRRLWTSVREILGHGVDAAGVAIPSTGLALGYVQSGKTTAMTALMAAAADAGYQVIVAFLGSTNILLDQNSHRIYAALGIETRSDYRWISMRNPGGPRGTRDLRDWLAKGRIALLPMLKHSGRIQALSAVVSRAVPPGTRVLIVDDEADQASLNTKVNAAEESRIYASLSALRQVLPAHLYVQYTATPYAPLLLEPKDHLMPTFVSFLHPGPSYTGGREFFVDHERQVIRPIPTLDEQPPKTLPTDLPKSLVLALANFIVGASTLLEGDIAKAPISMLVHSTQRNDVQARYFFLLERLLRRWRNEALKAPAFDQLPPELRAEREKLTQAGGKKVDDSRLLSKVRYVLGETKPWLINSTSDVKKIDWNLSPCHILVGGNKLDRGFTVEGLTVTYMNRATTEQVDTLEQRARAFGYRADLLPYCQFFATPRTLKVLKDIVFTEYDLRARLQDWLATGGSVEAWAHEVGLMLPPGMRPTRENVIHAMNSFNVTSRWHSLRRPSLDPSARRKNLDLVTGLGVDKSEPADYGRLKHRTTSAPLNRVIESLRRWEFSSYSPDWRHQDILSFLERQENLERDVPVLLLESANASGEPRERDWDEQTGFVNLFQGKDVRPVPGKPFYPGDRAIPALDQDPSKLVLQIHHVRPGSMPQVKDLYTLAVHLGDKANVRRGERLAD